MGDNLPQNPKAKKSWLKVFAFLEVGILEVLFVGVVLILLFGILNYFNILSLSELYPQLGFLPKKMDQGSQITSTQRNTNVLPIKLTCPSVREFCQTANGVIKEGKYVGWGSALASGSAIFAAFDGVLSSTTSTFSKEKNGETVEKQFVIAYLDNSDLKLRGIYYLRGPVSKTGKVSKGEQIAISNGKTISIYDNNSLIFSVIQDYPAINTPVILTQEQFE